jgi:hypothetical protein
VAPLHPRQELGLRSTGFVGAVCTFTQVSGSFAAAGAAHRMLGQPCRRREKQEPASRGRNGRRTVWACSRAGLHRLHLLRRWGRSRAPSPAFPPSRKVTGLFAPAGLAQPIPTKASASAERVLRVPPVPGGATRRAVAPVAPFIEVRVIWAAIGVPGTGRESRPLRRECRDARTPNERATGSSADSGFINRRGDTQP